MAKAHKASDSEKLAELIIEGIQEKKGKQIQLLDLRDINNAVCDFFIIPFGKRGCNFRSCLRLFSNN